MVPDDTLVLTVEAAAVEMARGAGEILAGHFGRQISIEYKDKERRDPVTSVDKACQNYLSGEISKQFPDHGILGEESAGGAESEEDHTPAPEFLWVLDPLDGTTNYLNGLPVYACSIGVLYRGHPIASALYLPWPNPGGGFVMHCRKGGGCFADEEPVSVYESTEPVANRLVGMPASFSQIASFSRRFNAKAGDTRVTGSVAYELAMTACGVLQYSFFGAPRIWDIAGGALAVMEAKGTVMTRFRGEKRWHGLESLAPTWEAKPPSLSELRRWVAPLVAGNRQVAPMVVDNMRPRFRPLARLRRFSRRFKAHRRS